MAGGIMSTKYLSVVGQAAGHVAEFPVLSLALRCGPITVIELSGDIDMSTTHLITDLVTDVAKNSPAQVVLDMTEVSFFCAAVLNALLHARETIKDAGGELLLRHPSKITMQILTMTRTAGVFPIDRHCVRGTEVMPDGDKSAPEADRAVARVIATGSTSG